jgi:hypothetical protein
LKLKLLLFTALCIRLYTVFAQTPDSLQTANVKAQDAPIPIELFAGNKELGFQLMVSKQFSPQSNFGFFNVTSFDGSYQQTNQISDFLSQSYVTAEIWHGFSIVGGLSAIGSSNSPLTVRPTAGLQYLLVRKDFVLVLLPRFDLTQTYNFETFAVLEYKPMLSKNWGIYTSVQGLYNYNTKLGYNEIVEIDLLLGLSYKNFQFGVFSIPDFNGVYTTSTNHFGLFIKTDLF